MCLKKKKFPQKLTQYLAHKRHSNEGLQNKQLPQKHSFTSFKSPPPCPSCSQLSGARQVKYELRQILSFPPTYLKSISAILITLLKSSKIYPRVSLEGIYYFSCLRKSLWVSLTHCLRLENFANLFNSYFMIKKRCDKK